MSTRRFAARLTSEVFGFTGFFSPRPTAANCVLFKLPLFRYFTTVKARSKERCQLSLNWLVSGKGRLSVFPSTWILSEEYFFNTLITLSKVLFPWAVNSFDPDLKFTLLPRLTIVLPPFEEICVPVVGVGFDLLPFLISFSRASSSFCAWSVSRSISSLCFTLSSSSCSFDEAKSVSRVSLSSLSSLISLFKLSILDSYSFLISSMDWVFAAMSFSFFPIADSTFFFSWLIFSISAFANLIWAAFCSSVRVLSALIFSILALISAILLSKLIQA